MSLKKLLKLVPPPESPMEVGSKSDWSRVERELGTALPSDYKQFVDRYGSGTFAKIFYIFNPFSTWTDYNLLEQLKQLRPYYEQEHQNDPSDYPYEVFPKRPGLLPWGHDTEGNEYLWLVGPPRTKADDWPVIFHEPRGNGFAQVRCSMTEYLARVLAGRIDGPVSNYPDPDMLEFEPFGPPKADSAEALFEAIRRNDLSSVKRMVAEKIDLNIEHEGQNALSVALKRGNLAISKLLLERGADINRDSSLLFFIAQSGDTEMVKFMLRSGADPNSKSPSGSPALFAAASLGDSEMIHELLGKGANPNSRDEEGRTPIFMAITENDEQTIRLLIEHGADLSVRDNDGLTPLEFAKKKRRDVAVKVVEASVRSKKNG
jgi:ankyrin repeat protein